MRFPVEKARERLAEGYDPMTGALCLCGAPQRAHSGPKHHGSHEPTRCRRFRVNAADELLEKALQGSGSGVLADLRAAQFVVQPRARPRPGGWGIGPSDLNSCGKAVQLRERPPEGFRPLPKDDAAAVIGTMWHDQVRRARQVLYPWRWYEHEVAVPGLDRPGRLDEYDPVLGEVADLKTCGMYSWERLGLEGPDPDHWAQVSVYAYALACAGEYVARLRLVYVNRESGEDEQFTIPYDEAEAKTALGRLRAMAVALDLGQDIPRDPRRTGPSSDGLCALCPVRYPCWNIEAAEAAGRSPESWTILGPDPEWEEIEWAAALAGGYAADKRNAKKSYDAALPLLTGIEPGTYGDWQVLERKRWMPDWAGWAKQVQAARERYQRMPEYARGDFAAWVEGIEVPKRRDVWVEVKPVRVAKQKKKKGKAA